jgi:hypothetical protein
VLSFLLGQIPSPARTRDAISPHVAYENPDRKTNKNSTGSQNGADPNPLKAHGAPPCRRICAAAVFEAARCPPTRQPMLTRKGHTPKPTPISTFFSIIHLDAPSSRNRERRRFVRWPRLVEQKIRVAKWIVGRGFEGGAPEIALHGTVEVQSVSGRTLGLIVTPLHPLRFAWHGVYDQLAAHARYGRDTPRVRASTHAASSGEWGDRVRGGPMSEFGLRLL